MEIKEIYKNLEDTRHQLVSVINALNNDQMNNKPEINCWSVSQVCHHLLLTEELFTKAIELGLKSKEDCFVENKPIELVSDLSKKLESPEIAKPTNEYLSYDKISEKLSISRNRLKDILNNIDDPSILNRRFYKHLVFKELSLIQWIELLYLHEQRHIEQIIELKKIL